MIWRGLSLAIIIAICMLDAYRYVAVFTDHFLDTLQSDEDGQRVNLDIKHIFAILVNIQETNLKGKNLI